jgi:hypothetical protein
MLTNRTDTRTSADEIGERTFLVLFLSALLVLLSSFFATMADPDLGYVLGDVLTGSAILLVLSPLLTIGTVGAVSSFRKISDRRISSRPVSMVLVDPVNFEEESSTVLLPAYEIRSGDIISDPYRIASDPDLLVRSVAYRIPSNTSSNFGTLSLVLTMADGSRILISSEALIRCAR